MKEWAMSLMIFFLVLGCQNGGQTHEAKKEVTEKGDMKVTRNNPETLQPERHQAGDWRHFKKPADGTLKKMLTPLQYKVTQQDGTEPPFHNEYDQNKREGIYVDIVSGEPLFSSEDKFDSGTGWPSFTRPLVPENIVFRKGWSFLTGGIEVRSKHADSHLGHVFHDGPPPTRLRYCMNSAALRFIPREKLDQEGYGEFTRLFKKQ